MQVDAHAAARAVPSGPDLPQARPGLAGGTRDPDRNCVSTPVVVPIFHSRVLQKLIVWPWFEPRWTRPGPGIEWIAHQECRPLHHTEPPAGAAREKLAMSRPRSGSPAARPPRFPQRRAEPPISPPTYGLRSTSLTARRLTALTMPSLCHLRHTRSLATSARMPRPAAAHHQRATTPPLRATLLLSPSVSAVRSRAIPFLPVPAVAWRGVVRHAAQWGQITSLASTPPVWWMCSRIFGYSFAVARA